MDKVVFGAIKGELSQFLSNAIYTKVALLVDENTKKHCLPLVEKLVPESHLLIEINSGEEHKNLETCSHIWRELTDQEFDRKALFINLGGGVIGDMGGFCAATYKRGIDFINIPTTLLAMVDASVGGKLGIDFGNLKNHIGIFQEPKHVFIDPVFLNTLPERELRSGFAEIIKHALITSEEQWRNISQHDFPGLEWTTIIPESVSIKQHVVEQDFKESGLRKTLNFGHTIGHAVESYFLENDIENKLLHGEAVAIGMICELLLSLQKLSFDGQTFQVISNYIFNVFGKATIPEGYINGIASFCAQDKKNTQSKIQAVLLKSIGTPLIDSEISTEEVIEVLHGYNKLNI